MFFFLVFLIGRKVFFNLNLAALILSCTSIYQIFLITNMNHRALKEMCLQLS